MKHDLITLLISISDTDDYCRVLTRQFENNEYIRRLHAEIKNATIFFLALKTSIVHQVVGSRRKIRVERFF